MCRRHSAWRWVRAWRWNLWFPRTLLSSITGYRRATGHGCSRFVVSHESYAKAVMSSDRASWRLRLTGEGDQYLFSLFIELDSVAVLLDEHQAAAALASRVLLLTIENPL